jgi:hypothetical protein
VVVDLVEIVRRCGVLSEEDRSRVFSALDRRPSVAA